MTASTDVVIVGAGPTGLMLAGDLADRAASGVTVLERRAATSRTSPGRSPCTPARWSCCDARGLADELIATGAAIRGLRLFGRLDSTWPRCRAAFPSC